MNHPGNIEARTTETPMSEDEADVAFGDVDNDVGNGIGGRDDAVAIDAATSDALPDWAPPLPPALKVPEDTRLTWIRIKAGLTAKPSKGDRVLVLWPLNEQEERRAVQRARGDAYLLTQELSKAAIRAIDQSLSDRTGVVGLPGNVSTLWREIGPKGRHLVRTYYTRTHTLTDEETEDFFLSSIVTRTAAPG